MIGALFVVLVATMMFLVDTPTAGESTVFGEVKVKPRQGATNKKQLSNYQAIKQEKEATVENRFRYKVKIKKENPLLSLYQEEKKPVIITNQPSNKKAPPKVSQEQAGFFSAQNTDLALEKKFFEAVFRETQPVQAGKALRIILKEAIPELSLASGTLLKGIPTLAGERIEIRITAAVVEDEVRPLDLVCFDKEDCIAGLYHDELAKRLEEDLKEGVLDEVLNLDFKGKELAKRATHLTRGFQSITIEKGREVFLAIPTREA